jgi:hypothetical protein
LISSKSSKRSSSSSSSSGSSSSSSSSRLQYSDDYYRKLLKDSGFNLDDITNNVNDNNLDDVDDDDNEDLDERARIEAKLINDSNEIHSLTCDNNDNSIKLYDDGVIRIDNVLSSNTTKELLSFITKELEIAIKDVETGIIILIATNTILNINIIGKVDVFERFSNLLSNRNRYDFKLPIDNDIIQNAIKEMVSKDSNLGKLLLKLVGKDSELFEVASFYTFPGSLNQVIHSDTIFTKKPVLFTITVALQDISLEMGPTLFLTRTHKKLYHNRFYHGGLESKNKLITENNKVYSILKAGDSAMYDSRVLHGGTANKSQKPRVLFYLSFINASGKMDDELDENSFSNVASIRPEYIRKYTLSSFQK